MSKLNSEFFIARRISSSEGGKKNAMIRIATITVAVGMAVMIIALAVINGFKKEITDKLTAFGAHVRVVDWGNTGAFETEPIVYDSALVNQFSKVPRFGSLTSYAIKGGMIKTPDAIQGIVLKGFSEGYDMSFFAGSLVSGELPETGGEERKKELLISQLVADMLELEAGDRVELLFVGDGRPVKRDRYKISGIYTSGMEEMDMVMTFTDIRNVQRLNGWDESQISGYEINTTDFSRLEEFREDIYEIAFNSGRDTGRILKAEDIISLNVNIFDWLRAHDTNAAVIIVIMLAVALLNMISALLITLLEKTPMIGVLKALGMTNRAVQKIFVIRSLKVVFTGMAYGNVVGIGLALIQKYTGVIKLDSSGYLISRIPIELGLDWLIMLNVGVPLLMLVLLAIPAMVVTGIKPEKTIRFQ